MEQNQSILTAHQREILETIAGEEYFTKRYYLAGGTALSEFYLKHRFSEDLDLFTEKDEVDNQRVLRFFQNKSQKLGIVSIDTRQVWGLFTLFLKFGDGDILKVDFNYYPFTRIERGKKFGNLEIEDIYDIGVDKTQTVVMKPRSRDFIDLFFILKEKNYNFRDLLMQAKAKFDWNITFLELGARLMEALELTDYPRMIKPIDHEEWRKFFVSEAEKLKVEIMN